MKSLAEQIALQIEWGADEILLEASQDRRTTQQPAIPQLGTPPAIRPARPASRPAALPAGPAEAAEIAAACNSLQALEAALGAFTGCALRDTATRLVFADGVPDARVMLIGEAPGAEEDRVGRPFVGAAGQLLDKMLASIGLDRNQLRIVNVVPWRPPGNRTPTEMEIAACLPFLHRHIALVDPDCLILLGATAAKAILPMPSRNSGIRRLRGNWHKLEIPSLPRQIPALPTYHPSYLLRTVAAKRDAWHDLLSLRHWLEASQNITIT